MTRGHARTAQETIFLAGEGRGSGAAPIAAPGPLLRRDDWPARLARYVEAWRDRRFAWGSADCAHFAAGAVEAVTGRRVGFPARWHDGASALQALRAVRGLQAAVDALLPRGAVTFAQRGDVLLVRQRARAHLAVCDADGWLTPGAGGLVRGSMRDVRVAWRVG